MSVLQNKTTNFINTTNSSIIQPNTECYHQNIYITEKYNHRNNNNSSNNNNNNNNNNNREINSRNKNSTVNKDNVTSPLPSQNLKETAFMIEDSMVKKLNGFLLTRKL